MRKYKIPTLWTSPSDKPPKPPKAAKPQYYIAENGNPAGPFTDAEMKTLVYNGTVVPTTWVWVPNMPEWVAAEQLPQVNKYFLLSRKKGQVSSREPEAKVFENPVLEDALSALQELGYKKGTVVPLLNELISQQKDLSAQELICQALKRM